MGVAPQPCTAQSLGQLEPAERALLPAQPDAVVRRRLVRVKKPSGQARGCRRPAGEPPLPIPSTLTGKGTSRHSLTLRAAERNFF